MKKQFIECGKVVTTHGIKGELKVYPWSDTPDFLADFAVVYTDKGGAAWDISSCRANKNTAILKLKGIDTMEAAIKLREKILYVNREDMNLDVGDFLIQDLIDLIVKDIDTGKIYGKITDVSPTGANDVYHITDEDGTLRLIPAIKQVVISTDLEEGVMLIRPLVGLFEDTEEVRD